MAAEAYVATKRRGTALAWCVALGSLLHDVSDAPGRPPAAREERKMREARWKSFVRETSTQTNFHSKTKKTLTEFRKRSIAIKIKYNKNIEMPSDFVIL